MSKVRFIMVGTGGMGRAHVRNILAIPDAQIVALVDPSQTSIDNARSLSESLATIPSFTNLTDALREVEADAAVIVTPHSQHFEQGMACLDAGLHVLMEKPFVAGSENAKAIIAHAQKLGRHLVVSYQRHTEGPYQYLHHLVHSGELGDIQFVTAYQAQAWLEGTRGTWRQDRTLSCGGQLNDSGSHLLDVVLWVTGLTPESVLASIDNRGTPVDIDTALSVRFTTGALCTFNIVGSANVDWWEDVSFHGTKGTALFRNGRIYVSKGLRQPMVELKNEDLPPTTSPDANFVDLVLRRIDTPAAPASCGYMVSRLTEAAWQSAESESWVRF